MALGIHEDTQSDGGIIYKLGHDAVHAKTTMGYKTEADAQAALDNINAPAVEEIATQIVEDTASGEPTTPTGDQQ